MAKPAGPVDAYAQSLRQQQRELVGSLRDIVRAASKNILEELKWGTPV
jgi:hypothetical protein